MKEHDTIPAESGKPCDCCRRSHRTLVRVGQFYLGKQCAQDYKHYSQTFDGQNPKSLYWRGYEKKFARVKEMAESNQ